MTRDAVASPYLRKMPHVPFSEVHSIRTAYPSLYMVREFSVIYNPTVEGEFRLQLSVLLL